MVNRQLRAMGLRLRAADAPPVDDGVRRPKGRPAPARPGWESFLVAVKPVGDPWPPNLRLRIQQARSRYEAGTHEMVTCTTTDGWTQLYSIPRREPAGHRPYFSTMPGVA